MSDTVNPWQSPSAEVRAEEAVPQGLLTPGMVRSLKDASPWLLFIGVLGYIGAIFLAVLGLVMGVLSAGGSPVFRGAAWRGTASAFVGPIYLVMGVLAFFPARFTHRFGMKIRHYLASGAEKDLEEALRSNKALWKFSGIMVIVYLGVIVLTLIGFVLSAIFS
jgi:hypothetical protein